MLRGRGPVIFCSCVLLSILVIVGPARPAAAAQLDVPGGFPTIQAALNAASAGDTIVVAAGTYNENVDFGAKDVTLQSSAGPETTTIMGSRTTVRIGPNGRLRGFTISGGTAPFGGGLEVTRAGTVIEGNVFADNAQDAGGYGAAIGGSGASPVILRNRFHRNTCDNQHLSGVVAFVNTSRPYIANNIFEDNPCRAINMTVPVAAQPMVVNNTIVRNRTGIYVGSRIDGHVYRNNIVFENGIGVEVVPRDPGSYSFDHNLVAGNGANYVGLPDQAGTAGNLSADPQFTGSALGDYHLSPKSPAVDAGSEALAPRVDFAGVARPADGNSDAVARTDIGAFETAGPTITAPTSMYVMVARDGGVFAPGGSGFHGTAGLRPGDGILRDPSGRIIGASGSPLDSPVVAFAYTPSRQGYWLVQADGGVIPIGDAPDVGDVRGAGLTAPIVGSSATRDGAGLYLVAADGGLFALGTAPFRGSLGGLALNKPIVGMGLDGDGTGYFLVASDGGVFAFGAAFRGSLGATQLNRPIVGIAVGTEGGYVLVASDGGAFTYGVSFAGSLGSTRLAAPIVGIALDPDSRGYWMAGADGGAFAFEAPFYGSVAPVLLNSPISGIAAI